MTKKFTLPKVITTEFLAGACDDQLELFRKTFPNGARANVTNLKKAMAAELELEWLIENRLPAPALAEYERGLATEWDGYERGKRTALVEIISKYLPK